MNDLEWLAAKVGTFAVGDFGVEGHSHNPAGIVVEPTHIKQATRLSDEVIALVGWPTGRHHTLIKAAEARLAVETGASEVWVVVDKRSDETATFAELVAVRQATEARIGAIVPAGQEALARKAGADVVVVEYGAQLPEGEFVVYGPVPDIDATIDVIGAGASRVFATDPAAATS